MPIAHTEFEIALNDLRFFSLKCAECSTVITLDMERGTGQTVFSLTSCPICNRAFDSCVPNILHALHTAYVGKPDWLRKLIRFRIASDDIKP